MSSNKGTTAASDAKKISWITLAFMAFSTVWGFGNVVNGFGYFNGTQVIFSWIMMFALYFVPYALMVGELGSAFKNAGGGVTSWVLETTNPKLAYYAGYTYWVVHIPYIASKGSGGLKALAWMFLRNEWYDSLPSWQVQLATGVVFVFFLWVASKGLQPLKALTSLAGSSMFVMSLLYIVMMFAAPMINPSATYVPLDWSWEHLIPQFNVQYFTSLSILVFAVGGCEKISPYVNKVNNPGKDFPKGMIALAIMVMICAVLGTIAMGMMIPAAEITGEAQASFIANGAYECFQKLGEYYHVGSFFVIVYGACNAIGQFSTLVLSIDAPLRMLLDDESARQFVPKGLLKQNKNGAYVNGIILIGILSGSIIAIQLLGKSAADIITWLTKLNSVCMPMRYLWVFFAYIMLRKAGSKFHSDYVFVKNKNLAIFFGGWCFFVTAACCILGVYQEGDMLRTILNIVMPFVLLALGLIMPAIRKQQDEAEKAALH
ncbi:amino acid permease [Erysipelotrichaceae bacterium 51-3]|uniref:APC family permease n=1 Tax=Allobaculum sp. JKK-2023 TaxID=3108943 RepID=UPI002B056B39|nr:amino acid permease [Allobaculum sp. JKK-2023]